MPLVNTFLEFIQRINDQAENSDLTLAFRKFLKILFIKDL